MAKADPKDHLPGLFVSGVGAAITVLSFVFAGTAGTFTFVPIPFPGGEALAAMLPSARFVPRDGDWHLPDARDVDDIIGAVEALLGS